MRKILLFTLLLFVLSTSTVFASDINVYINDELKSFNPAPQIISGTTLVPMRAFFEALDAEVGWDGPTQTVTGVRGNVKVELQIDNKIAFVNGQEKELSVPAQIIEGRTFIPLRFVGEALGEEIEWDGKTRTIKAGSSSKKIETIEYENGDVYKGEIKNGSLHGYGTYTWADGSSYEGKWVNNQFEGKGKFIWPSGSTYEGEFLNNKPHGFGTSTTKDGKTFTGQWVNGEPVTDCDSSNPPDSQEQEVNNEESLTDTYQNEVTNKELLADTCSDADINDESSTDSSQNDDQIEQNIAIPDSGSFMVVGNNTIVIGESTESVLQKLGGPSRKDLSQYGFEWYVYNQDYQNYIQVGIENGKVVGIFSNAGSMSLLNKIAIGDSAEQVYSSLGKEPLESIQIGNTTYYMFGAVTKEYDLFLINDDSYATVFYDKHNNSTVTSVEIVEKDLKVKQFTEPFNYPKKDITVKSFEKQVWDLANSVRVRNGKQPFLWEDILANNARNHSKDMAIKGFFAHINPDGESPYDRMEKDGIDYMTAGENICGGQESGIYAHETWMNSMGHRMNILGDFECLGVGVYIGSDSEPNYTQVFRTPR